MQIEQINVDEIMPHPHQFKIYGETTVDDEFVNIIADSGILQPVILTDARTYHGQPEKTYVCISGHRRIEAAKQAGFETVPAYIKDYPDRNIGDFEHIVTNKSREKTFAQRKNEFLELKQKLRQITKLKQFKHLQNWVNKSDYENNEFSRILKNKHFTENKPMNAIDILKKETEFTKYEQEVINRVWDEKADSKRMALVQKGMPMDYINKMFNEQTEIQDLLDNKKISLNEADKKVKEIWKDANKELDRILGKDKKTKVKKEPAPKPPDEKMFFYGKRLTVKSPDFQMLFQKECHKYEDGIPVFPKKVIEKMLECDAYYTHSEAPASLFHLAQWLGMDIYNAAIDDVSDGTVNKREV